MSDWTQTDKERQLKIARLQGAIDRKMCKTFWHIPARGCYQESPAFYQAIKTPEDTLETLNDLRQISSGEFYAHRTIYVRGATAAISWHNWKPGQIQELMYAGTWFLMFKKELNSPNYNFQLKTLLRVIKEKVSPLAAHASPELQQHWDFIQNYWNHHCAGKRSAQAQQLRTERSLA